MSDIHWLSAPPQPARRLTKAKEAHQQQHQKPVRKATGVAEGRQRPGDSGGVSTSLRASVCQKGPRFIFFLLHRAGGRPITRVTATPMPRRILVGQSSFEIAVTWPRSLTWRRGRSRRARLTWSCGGQGLRGRAGGGVVFWCGLTGKLFVVLRSLKSPPAAFQLSPLCPFVSWPAYKCSRCTSGAAPPGGSAGLPSGSTPGSSGAVWPALRTQNHAPPSQRCFPHSLRFLLIILTDLIEHHCISSLTSEFTV